MADASIALNRFGLGARPDESIPSDPKRWLKGQLDSFEPKPPAFASVPTREKVAGELADFYDQQRQLRQQGLGRRQLANATTPMPGGPQASQPAAPAPQMQPGGPAMPMVPMPGAKPDPAAGDPLMAARRFVGGQVRDDYATAVGARLTAALTSPTPFADRLAHFWANHFAVSADKLEVIGLSGLLEFEAIRPNMMGTFGDMLNAVERHPAMLLYLDQAVSIGPDSMAGQLASRRPRANGKGPGLNENLAREIMELHTLGVRSGYTQADVTEFARALTGWTVKGIGRGPGARLAGIDDGSPGEFAFAPRLHEPGERTIIGVRYAQDGEKQAQAVLDTLATSPATAQHIATKLARHFAGDTPPPALVARLKANFLKTGGRLARALPRADRQPGMLGGGTRQVQVALGMDGVDRPRAGDEADAAARSGRLAQPARPADLEAGVARGL